MLSKGVLLLLWIIFIHFSGIYLFLRGFLLTRLSLSQTASCGPESQLCTLPSTHKRAVVLIIDALRFDFIAPDPPAHPVSPYHHGVLTLPRDLTAQRPLHSFVFNAHADPPTTTLQRIKGITTGSLPTFVDMGSNFGGAAIDEDSLVKQLRLAGKKIAFMGDDTWTTVFPDSFHKNMSFPYDSFNVEDLHTVDEGVIAHLLPLMHQDTSSWDFLIGHFLGVDHVGHRLGPDHPTMRAKLQQMNDVLSQVVDLLDDDTLLVLLGDHGMDATGDHGGDGVLETSSGVWIYSKSHPLVSPSSSSFFSAVSYPPIPDALLQKTTFPRSSIPHRAIQQIDLVPTLALLLGLPIPFNSLGTIIPELFNRDSLLVPALDINAKQVHSYLSAYRASTAGGELDGAWEELEAAWSESTTTAAASEKRLEALHAYTRLALAACRALWAQFNVILIVLGMTLLLAGAGAVWVLFVRLEDVDVGLTWDVWVGERLMWGMRGAAGGTVLGVEMYLLSTGQPFLEGLDALDCVLFSALLFSVIALIISARPRLSVPTFSTLLVPLPLFLHTVAFLSNSFTVWEDRIVLFLLVSTLLIPVFGTGLAAPTARLLTRILGYTFFAILCARLAGWSTVCREEQGPACHATFFAGASLPSPPPLVLALAVPATLGLPWAIRRILSISKSDRGVGSLFFPLVLIPALLLGTAFWVLEHIEAAEILGDGGWWVRSVRTGVARCAIAIGVGGGLIWWMMPVCLEVSTATAVDEIDRTGQEKKQVTVLGFGNAYGAPYLVFWCIALAGIWVFTQLTGQLVLALTALTLLAHLEVVDSTRDVHALQAAFASSTPSTALNLDTTPPPAHVRFAEVIPLALLGTHAFFATGHQTTIPSIQWKAAFVLSREVVYPWSPAAVVLNSFGAQVLLGLAVPLLAMWNVSPLVGSPAPKPPQKRGGGTETDADAGSPTIRIGRETLRAALGMVLYYSILMLGALGAAGALRRHLMVWKVWAPRVGVAVGAWGVVAIAVLLGWGIGVARILGKGGVGGVLGRLGVSA